MGAKWLVGSVECMAMTGSCDLHAGSWGWDPAESHGPKATSAALPSPRRPGLPSRIERPSLAL